jgi:hypothetical protein
MLFCYVWYLQYGQTGNRASDMRQPVQTGKLQYSCERLWSCSCACVEPVPRPRVERHRSENRTCFTAKRCRLRAQHHRSRARVSMATYLTKHMFYLFLLLARFPVWPYPNADWGGIPHCVMDGAHVLLAELRSCRGEGPSAGHVLLAELQSCRVGRSLRRACAASWATQLQRGRSLCRACAAGWAAQLQRGRSLRSACTARWAAQMQKRRLYTSKDRVKENYVSSTPNLNIAFDS